MIYLCANNAHITEICTILVYNLCRCMSNEKIRRLYMEEKILKEISESLSWYEKIVVKVFKKIIYKIYQDGVKNGYNWKI